MLVKQENHIGKALMALELTLDLGLPVDNWEKVIAARKLLLQVHENLIDRNNASKENEHV